MVSIPLSNGGSINADLYWMRGSVAPPEKKHNTPLGCIDYVVISLNGQLPKTEGISVTFQPDNMVLANALGGSARALLEPKTFARTMLGLRSEQSIYTVPILTDTSFSLTFRAFDDKGIYEPVTASFLQDNDDGACINDETAIFASPDLLFMQLKPGAVRGDGGLRSQNPLDHYCLGTQPITGAQVICGFRTIVGADGKIGRARAVPAEATTTSIKLHCEPTGSETRFYLELNGNTVAPLQLCDAAYRDGVWDDLPEQQKQQHGVPRPFFKLLHIRANAFDERRPSRKDVAQLPSIDGFAPRLLENEWLIAQTQGNQTLAEIGKPQPGDRIVYFPAFYGQETVAISTKTGVDTVRYNVVIEGDVGNDLVAKPVILEVNTDYELIPIADDGMPVTSSDETVNHHTRTNIAELRAAASLREGGAKHLKAMIDSVRGLIARAVHHPQDFGFHGRTEEQFAENFPCFQDNAGQFADLSYRDRMVLITLQNIAQKTTKQPSPRVAADPALLAKFKLTNQQFAQATTAFFNTGTDDLKLKILSPYLLSARTHPRTLRKFLSDFDPSKQPAGLGGNHSFFTETALNRLAEACLSAKYLGANEQKPLIDVDESDIFRWVAAAPVEACALIEILIESNYAELAAQLIRDRVMVFADGLQNVQQTSKAFYEDIKSTIGTTRMEWEQALDGLQPNMRKTLNVLARFNHRVSIARTEKDSGQQRAAGSLSTLLDGGFSASSLANGAGTDTIVAICSDLQILLDQPGVTTELLQGLSANLSTLTDEELRQCLVALDEETEQLQITSALRAPAAKLLASQTHAFMRQQASGSEPTASQRSATKPQPSNVGGLAVKDSDGDTDSHSETVQKPAQTPDEPINTVRGGDQATEPDTPAETADEILVNAEPDYAGVGPQPSPTGDEDDEKGIISFGVPAKDQRPLTLAEMVSIVSTTDTEADTEEAKELIGKVLQMGIATEALETGLTAFLNDGDEQRLREHVQSVVQNAHDKALRQFEPVEVGNNGFSAAEARASNLRLRNQRQKFRNEAGQLLTDFANQPFDVRRFAREFARLDQAIVIADSTAMSQPRPATH